ncbi:MAG: Npt1/Npt2 family nucleotide transporter [Polyangiales bacterium]
MTRVSRADRNAALIAGVTAGFMIAQQIAGKATRDALFLSHFAATELPKVIIAAAGVSVVAVAVMSRLMVKFGPARLIPAAFVLSAGVFVAEWALLPVAPGPSAWLVYLHLATFGAIVISGFWSLVSERFDPNTAKKQMARIGAGATLGGVVGGLGAERLAVMLDARTTLLVLAALNIVCAFGVSRVGRGQSATKKTETSESGLAILRRVPYLQHLAVLVGLVAVTSVLLDFALKEAAAAEYERTEDLMRFFGVFYTATGVLTFVVQSTFARRALARLGLGGTIALLPLSVIVFGTLGAALTQLWTLAVAKGAEFVAANSFFRSGYELLYTPLSAQEKRPTKTIIDVAFERIGDAVGGGIVFLVLLVAPVFAGQIIVGLALVTAIGALLVARKLHQGYIGALAASLKSGTLRLTEDEVQDATTRRTLVQTTMALDRGKLLEEIALLRGTPPDELPLVDTKSSSATDAHALDAQEIRELLEQRPLPLANVGVLIPWLADPGLNKLIIESLSAVSTQAQDQLVEALLEAGQPFAVRRRLPRILASAVGERARQGLTLGLRDERFEVRYQCCQSLALMQRRTPEATVFEEELVFGMVLRELDVGKHVWENQRLLDDDSNENSPWLDSTIRARVHRSVEHIFTLLSLCLDAEALELALTALGTDDRVLRGTALEYLDNVLPGDVRTKLWPLLAPNHRKRSSSRPRKQIVEELLQSLDSFNLDREALRKQRAPKSDE